MLVNINKRKGSTKGFTIIEVLIVLAIAGLILLIVFLAVPALQRSARNTQRKNDVAAVASAVANYISNNNGVLPDYASPGTGGGGISVDVGCKVPAGGGPTGCSGTNIENAKLGFYTNPAANVKFYTSPPGGGSLPTTEQIWIIDGYTCNGTTLGTANARTAALLYATESGPSSASEQCLEQ